MTDEIREHVDACALKGNPLGEYGEVCTCGADPEPEGHAFDDCRCGHPHNWHSPDGTRCSDCGPCWYEPIFPQGVLR